MDSHSPQLSEGEVSSVEDVKVHECRSDYQKNIVDRESRRGPNPRNSRRESNENANIPDMTSYNPYRRQRHDRSRSPYRARRHSRSPYRAERSRSRSLPRTSGAGGHDKRRRNDDHYRNDDPDSRRSKRHHEDSRSSRDQRSRYTDIDRPSRVDIRDHQPSGTARPRQTFVRSRSRSPPRHDRRREDFRQPPENSSTKLDYSEPPKRESSPSALKTSNFAKSEPLTIDENSAQSAAAGYVSSHASSAEELVVVNIHDSSPALSEAELIEQRRKRREAIRAKHQSSSLLVKVLEPTLPQDAGSVPSTPQHDSVSQADSPSSVADSPQTPQDATPPGTPDFTMHNTDDLIEPQLADHQNLDEGPSAADFNPEELNEDRLKYQPPSTNDTDAMEISTSANNNAVDTQVNSPKEFDMFAEADDDDDMFAALDATAPKGKTLDQSIMDNWDHPDGHYRIIRGEILDHRYNVLEQIGKGTFATVVRAFDQDTGRKVAIKIACNNDTMLKAGRREIKFLKQLNDGDPDDKKHIIRFHREFTHKHHLCLVFEGLSDDLRALLKKLGRNVGLRLHGIRTYAYQLFLALDHMRKSEVLHADLKPDNILVNEHPYNIVKICDFGTALDQRDVIEPTPFLVSRFYRPPEIIIGVPYDSAIDMWSIGCTLFELYTDKILFRGATNNTMLKEIQTCLGKLPLRVIKRGQLAGEYFDISDPAYPFYAEEQDAYTNKTVMKAINFKQQPTAKTLKTRLGAGVQGGVSSLRGDELREHLAFLDLLEKCLQLDPEKRIRPRDALRHHFLHRPPTAAPA